MSEKIISVDSKGEFLRVYPKKLTEIDKQRIARAMDELVSKMELLEEEKKAEAQKYKGWIETCEAMLKVLIRTNRKGSREFFEKVTIQVVTKSTGKELQYINKNGEIVHTIKMEKGDGQPLLFQDDSQPLPIYLDLDGKNTLDEIFKPHPQKD